MAEQTPKSTTLTVVFVRTVRHSGKPGVDKYGDQHGLILRVLPSGSKEWIWRGTVLGGRVDMGLGGYPYVILGEARQKAFEYRRLSRAGVGPRACKRGVPTFTKAADKVIVIHRASWRPGGMSEDQWRASLRDYAVCLRSVRRKFPGRVAPGGNRGHMGPAAGFDEGQDPVGGRRRRRAATA